MIGRPTKPLFALLVLLVSSALITACGDDCDVVASSCPGTCATINGLEFDDANDCVLPASTQGCIDTLGGESDIAACAVRRSDGVVFRLVGGADAWRLINNHAAWTTCETEVEAVVLEAPVCGSGE